MLAAEAERARLEREKAEPTDAALPIERKPTASVRLPPIPKRADRDQAAARRATTAGDAAPLPVSAPGTGPAGLPKPITQVIAAQKQAESSTQASAATKRAKTAQTKAKAAAQAKAAEAKAKAAAETKAKAKAKAEAEAEAEAEAKAKAEAEAKAKAEAEAKAKAEAEAKAKAEAAEPANRAKPNGEGAGATSDSKAIERQDPSEPQLLAPHPTAELDEWPDPDSVGVAPAKPDSGEWPTPDRSDTFTTPATRTQLAGTKSKTPSVDPVPEVPDGGLWPPVKYLVSFVRGRWQRRGAINTLKEQITKDTGSLDALLGDLGREVRELGINNRGLAAENSAIDEAEKRKAAADRELSEQQNYQAEENNRFAEIESDRQAKVHEAEATLETARQELGSLEAQRRGLRDKRKAISQQQDGLVKAAEDRENKAAKQPMGDERAALRRSAEDLRREAAGLDPDRQDIDRRQAALEKPISVASAKVEALKAELESAKRSLNDAREGHRHKQSEIDAEKGKKSRELAQAEAEIKRRLVTLGTLVNLNRIDRDEFVETYGKIDVLRGAIGSRTTEIDRLAAEREAYDRQSLIRGALVLGGAIVVLCLIIALLILVI